MWCQMGNVIINDYKVGNVIVSVHKSQRLIATPGNVRRESLLMMTLGTGRNRSDIDSHLKCCSRVNGSQVKLQNPSASCLVILLSHEDVYVSTSHSLHYQCKQRLSLMIMCQCSPMWNKL